MENVRRCIWKREQLGVEKRDLVGVPLPALDKDSEFQTLIRCMRTPPNLPIRVELQGLERVLRGLCQQIASLLGFSTGHCISLGLGNQDPV